MIVEYLVVGAPHQLSMLTTENTCWVRKGHVGYPIEIRCVESPMLPRGWRWISYMRMGLEMGVRLAHIIMRKYDSSFFKRSLNSLLGYMKSNYNEV